MKRFFRFGTSKKDSASEEQTSKFVSQTVFSDETKKEDFWNAVYGSPRLGNVPKQAEGEQIAAGWPGWLTAVAGEALMGWLPRRADSFEKIDKIGQGTYSNVYKARDIESGKVVALKKVRFDNLEPESVKFMAREIIILRRLDHPNVVKLEGLVTSRMFCSLYLVFDFLDHDLAGIASSANITFTEAQVKCYLLQILKGLEHCHSRGVLHRDIKGSNLLLDSEGNLKIADFGLATFFHPDKQQQLTTRVVTLWYRPPELLLGATEYGTAIDIWSVGCILGELFAGKPILSGRTEVEQLHKIFKLCGSPPDEYWKKYKLSHATIFKPQHPYKRVLTENYKHFPQTALDLLDIMLAFDPEDRGSASTALQSDFFKTKPFACEPSSLPKYVSTKGDGKGRPERGRRQRAASGKVCEVDASRGEHNQQNPIKESNQDYLKKEENQKNPNAASQEGKREVASSNGARLSDIQSARSRSARFAAPAKELASKLPADGPKQLTERGRNRVYAVPPDPMQTDAAIENISWAGLWGDRRPLEDGTGGAVRNHLPQSQSVRYTMAAAEPGSQGSFLPEYKGASLSKLSTLVATRNSRGQEVPGDSVQTKWEERVCDRMMINELARQNPVEFKGGLDEFDMQDDAYYDEMKQLGLRLSASRLHVLGPLLPPSTNVDHSHERETRGSRRTRHERSRNLPPKGPSQVYSGGKAPDGISRTFSVQDGHEPTVMVNNQSRSKYISHISNPATGEEYADMDASHGDHPHEL